MAKISFSHGGPEYDAKYPDGIPTSIDITTRGGKKISSGLVMYPSGHARLRFARSTILTGRAYAATTA